MLCQDCQNNKASVNIRQIVNGQEVILVLCAECAKRRGFSNPLKAMPFPLADFLSSMVSQHGGEPREEFFDEVCPVCNLSYAQFAKTGRLGCGNCFSVFRKPLADLLRKIHGSNLHRGKRPKGEASMEPLKEEARLRYDLQRAIDKEDFERAAQIRDMLKELQEKLEVTDV